MVAETVTRYTTERIKVNRGKNESIAASGRSVCRASHTSTPMIRDSVGMIDGSSHAQGKRPSHRRKRLLLTGCHK